MVERIKFEKTVDKWPRHTLEHYCPSTNSNLWSTVRRHYPCAWQPIIKYRQHCCQTYNNPVELVFWIFTVWCLPFRSFVFFIAGDIFRVCKAWPRWLRSRLKDVESNSCLYHFFCSSSPLNFAIPIVLIFLDISNPFFFRTKLLWHLPKFKSHIPKIHKIGPKFKSLFQVCWIRIICSFYNFENLGFAWPDQNVCQARARPGPMHTSGFIVAV